VRQVVPSSAGIRRPNPVFEGFIVAAIYYAVATPLFILQYVYLRTGSGLRLLTSLTGVAVVLGAALAQLTLLCSVFSVIVAMRNYARVDKNVFRDFRFWVVVLGIAAIRFKLALGLFWCGAIYAYRENRRHRVPSRLLADPKNRRPRLTDLTRS
jgi:hypothetical protein